MNVKYTIESNDTWVKVENINDTGLTMKLNNQFYPTYDDHDGLMYGPFDFHIQELTNDTNVNILYIFF